MVAIPAILWMKVKTKPTADVRFENSRIGIVGLRQNFDPSNMVKSIPPMNPITKGTMILKDDHGYLLPALKYVSQPVAREDRHRSP